MTRVRLATPSDIDYLSQNDRIHTAELDVIVRHGRILIAEEFGRETAAGWLRWGLFWAELPFMNMLHVAEERRGSGIGSFLVSQWETQCRDAGYSVVLTSTQSNESAQHFYRRLGYRDAGGLLLPEEPLGILFVKYIGDSRKAAVDNWQLSRADRGMSGWPQRTLCGMSGRVCAQVL